MRLYIEIGNSYWPGTRIVTRLSTGLYYQQRLGTVIGQLGIRIIAKQFIRNDQLLVNIPLFSVALFLLSRSAGIGS